MEEGEPHLYWPSDPTLHVFSVHNLLNVFPDSQFHAILPGIALIVSIF